MNTMILKAYVKLQALKTHLKDEQGQDLIEYALVVALIAFAAIAGMNAVATQINTAFIAIGNRLQTATAVTTP